VSGRVVRLVEPGTSPLPARSFAELSVDLRLFAQREAMGIPQLEVFIAKTPEPSLALRQTLEDAKRAAVNAGLLADAFAKLVDREADVRAFLDMMLERPAFAVVWQGQTLPVRFSTHAQAETHLRDLQVAAADRAAA